MTGTIVRVDARAETSWKEHSFWVDVCPTTGLGKPIIRAMKCTRPQVMSLIDAGLLGAGEVRWVGLIVAGIFQTSLLAHFPAPQETDYA